MNPLACVLDIPACATNLWDTALATVDWPWFVTGLIIGALLGKYAVAALLFVLAVAKIWRPAASPLDPAEHFPEGHPDPKPVKKHRPTIFDGLGK